nr:hypothetical protein BaRGS_006716 [Batillaria attramentaria]
MMMTTTTTTTTTMMMMMMMVVVVVVVVVVVMQSKRYHRSCAQLEGELKATGQALKKTLEDFSKDEELKNTL